MSIVVEDYHKHYDGTVAVAGLSFTVAEGEILGLVGPNGAGKTTTLRALAGILTPTQGRLLIAGHDLALEPVPAKAAQQQRPGQNQGAQNQTGQNRGDQTRGGPSRGGQPKSRWTTKRKTTAATNRAVKFGS